MPHASEKISKSDTRSRYRTVIPFSVEFKATHSSKINFYDSILFQYGSTILPYRTHPCSHNFVLLNVLYICTYVKHKVIFLLFVIILWL